MLLINTGARTQYSAMWKIEHAYIKLLAVLL